MGRYVEQNTSRSELQERIAADIRARAAAKSKQEDAGEPDSVKNVDGVDDSAYIENTKATTTLAWAWVLIIFMVIGVFVVFVVQVNK
jgi:hypothetical protein